MRRLISPVVMSLACAALAAAPASADFPWKGAGDASDPATWHTVPGKNAEHTGTADEITCSSWKGAATPEPNSADCPDANGAGAAGDAQNEAVRNDPQELGGVRGDGTTDVYATDPFTGDPVRTAWNVTTGRPDVTIAVLDSGIEWDNDEAMADLANKVRLNTGELPKPNHLAPTALLKNVDCATYANAYDANGDGVVNLADYACDSRIHMGSGANQDMLTPEDLLVAFSDGRDADHNGFVDDIAGWDFVDDDNDPFDDVSYGHGTGEARDSTAEANNGGDVGTCPNCTVVPLRVGESFIADVNRFAQAVLYAADNGASVVQEALGTLNNSTLARNAIDYAYGKGVTIVASAADEAAQHHNQPGVLPHVILVNSVTQYDQTFTPQPRSYLMFNGCTNFMAKVTVSVPSSSCSSEATGRSAGIVGLMYSAAKNAGATLTPDEARQLFQSTADDVSFADSETSCPAPHCTDPNLNAPSHRLTVSPLADTKPYPARGGADEFYGYGRLDAYRAVKAIADGRVPAEASIESPDWWDMADPGRPAIDIRGRVDARRAADGYTCNVYVAPGVDPNNGSDVSPREYGILSDRGDFHWVGGGFCDGVTVHHGASAANQLLGSIKTMQLKSWFPPQTSDFTGNENGGLAQSSNGRPNSEPYAFTVKVNVIPVHHGINAIGEDRRELYLHRDQDLLPGWPKHMTSDGASSPLFVDLDGDNRNELVFGTSDGEVHAYRRDGSELPGFPVHGDPLPIHRFEPAFAGGAVPAPPGAAILSSVAAGDLDGDGVPELVAADLNGGVYAWSATGKRILTLHSNPAFSGKPLAPFHNVRHGRTDRIERGFLGSPVLADLDGDHRPEIVAASLDRHLYAWHAGGTPVDGFPVLIVDRSKGTVDDPATDHVAFKPDSGARMQGKLVDTPAVGDVDGDGKPEILVGSNEEYLAGQDGGMNAGALNAASLNVVGKAGVLTFANGRVYAVKATGTSSGSPFLAGWPVKVGIINAELLPDVGEGINGSPVLAPLSCPSGGSGTKVGVMPAAGVGYVLNGNGSSCYGKAPSLDGAQADVGLQTDAGAGAGQLDHPVFPAVGLPAFGDLGGTQPSFVAPVAGLLRAVDLIAPDYQLGGQDFTAAWDTATGQFRPGFPAAQNDLSFLTGPVVADIDGTPGQEVVAGTASLDLQAFDAAGLPASRAWPKLTGDWMVATPAIGSLGTTDTSADAHKVVVGLTRLGTVFAYDSGAPACSPSSWPRFHHDNANSGDYSRDAILPGKPASIRLDHGALGFTAPGDDLLCGTVKGYEVRIDGGAWKPLGSATIVAPGATQWLRPATAPERSIEVRAVDDQGNVGRAATVEIPPVGAPPEEKPPANDGAGGPQDNGGPHDSSGPDHTNTSPTQTVTGSAQGPALQPKPKTATKKKAKKHKKKAKPKRKKHAKAKHRKHAKAKHKHRAKHKRHATKHEKHPTTHKKKHPPTHRPVA